MLQYTDPKMWGPYFWFVMRCVAYNFPDNSTIYDSRYYVDFYTNLKYVLPCEKCKASYSKLIDKYPIEQYTKSKIKLLSWVELMYQETDKEIKASIENAKPAVKFVPKKPVAKPIKKINKVKKTGYPSAKISSRQMFQLRPKATGRSGCNCGNK